MAEPETGRTDRIYIDESVIEIYRQLRIGTNTQPEESPFETFKDIFMLATCLGYNSGQRSKLPSGNKHDIRVSVFTQNDLALLKAIALADTGDMTILSRFSEILVIAEEYAQTGIYDVKGYLLDERGRPLWNLISLISHT